MDALKLSTDDAKKDDPVSPSQPEPVPIPEVYKTPVAEDLNTPSP